MMTIAALAAHLGRIENLRAFSTASKIPRRTLYTVMRRENVPTDETRAKIEQKLVELQPKLRPRPRPAPKSSALEAA